MMALSPLRLELKRVVHCHVGAGNQTWSSGRAQCSLPLSHLSVQLFEEEILSDLAKICVDLYQI